MTSVSLDDLLSELDEIADRFDALGRAPVAKDIATALADEWIRVARNVVGVDTGQLKARTRIVSITGTPGHAEAILEADTPYAGYHNYGTWRTPPNRFWTYGADAAELLSRRLGAPLQAEVSRVLKSGGVWNPHAGWTA